MSGAWDPVEFDLPLGGGFVTGAPEGIGEAPWEEVPEPEPVDLGEPGSDPVLEFRKTLGRFATGVTIVTTRARDQVHGMTANAFMSVSLRPPLVLISVDKRARLNRLLRVGSLYGVSVLSEAQHALSDRFAGRSTDGGTEIEFTSIRDTPLVEGAVAHIVARVVQTYWGGDHALFLGQVEYARHAEGRPLLFHGGRYEHLHLSDVPLLSALPPLVRERMLASGQDRSFEPGEAIVRAGDPGDELFLVNEGAARIEREGRVVERLSPGDFFGEIAVLDGGSRTADVIAETPVRCLVVPRESLRQALLSEPEAAWEMLRVLAGRLRER